MLTALLAASLAAGPTGNIVVSCDCNGVIVYLDGRASAPVPQQRVELMGVPAGRHQLRADAYPTKFENVTFYDGPVDIVPGSELHAKVRKGEFKIYETVRIGPPAPPVQPPPPEDPYGQPRPPPGVGTGQPQPPPAYQNPPTGGGDWGRDPFRVAFHHIDDAIEKNSEIDSRCQDHVDHELDKLKKRVAEVQRDPRLKEADRLVDRAKDLRDLIDDQCPERVENALEHNMNRVVEATKSIRELIRNGGGGTVVAGGYGSGGYGSGGYGQPPPVVRDCGTGPQDPGCNMQSRDGQWAMDAAAFNSFYGSLRSNPNELIRKDMAMGVINNSYLTARQLGMVMDLFANELLKKDVAYAAAPRVVDPRDAVGLSAKFRNSIFQGEWVQLISRY